MKRILIWAAVLMLCLCVSASAAARLELEQSGTVKLALGETLTIGYTSVPEGESLKYSSSNAKVAAAWSSGKVGAKGEGTAVITVRSQSGQTDSFKVQVYDPAKPTKVELEQSGTVKLNMGETMQLAWKVSPATAKQGVKFTSSNASVVKVSSKGVLTPVKEGTATITIKTNTAGKTDTVKVKVVDNTKPTKVVLAQSDTVKLNMTETLQLEWRVYPSTAKQGVKFVSSNTSVAKVSSKGVVTPVKEGTATITVKTNSQGKTDTVKVKVVDNTKPTKVVLAQSGTAKLNMGETLQLEWRVYPATAKPGVKFTSSNTAIAKVSSKGVVTPVKEGTVTITVKTNSQGKTDTVKVKVADPHKATAVEIQGAYNISLGSRDTHQLTAVLKPANATTKVKWASSNTAVAKVSSSGKITAVSGGTAIITATAGSQKDQVKVVVTSGSMPKGVSIEGASSRSLRVGETAQLKASLAPAKAIGSISWESTSPLVVKVDNSGKITAQRPGTASIVARSNRNGVYGYIRVTVSDASGNTQNTLPLAGIRIGIDPGHQIKGNSGKEPLAPGSTVMKAKCSDGTRGQWTGATEYAVNLQVGLKLRDYLTSLGAEVYMTRVSHYVDISNVERAKMLNEAGVDLAIRLHCNGSTNASDSGIFIYGPSGLDISAASKSAGNAMLSAMKKATGTSKGAMYMSQTYTGLNWSTVPALLVEMGYMSNRSEDYKLSDPEYQDKLVKGMANGVLAYFGKN